MTEIKPPSKIIERERVLKTISLAKEQEANFIEEFARIFHRAKPTPTVGWVAAPKHHRTNEKLVCRLNGTMLELVHTWQEPNFNYDKQLEQYQRRLNPVEYFHKKIAEIRPLIQAIKIELNKLDLCREEDADKSVKLHNELDRLEKKLKNYQNALAANSGKSDE